MKLSAIVAVGGASLTAILELALPAQTGRALNAVTSGTPAGPAILTVAALLGARLVAGVAAALGAGRYRVQATKAARSGAVAGALRQRELPVGDVTSRMLVDGRHVGLGLSVKTEVALSAALLTGALIALLLVHWAFLVGLLVSLVAVIVLVRRFVSDTEPALHRYRAGQSHVAEGLLEARRGAATIQACGAWRTDVARILRPLPEVRAAADDLWVAQRSLAWRIGSIAILAQTVTIAVSAVLLSVRAVPIGSVAAALGYAGVALAALDGVESATGLNTVRVARQRLDQLKPRSNQPVVGHATSGLRLRGVTVEGVLRDADLDVLPGSLTVVTVRPGIPSSRLARVFAGLDVPSSGRVLRPQRTVLAGGRPAFLGGTVAGLIALGVPDCPPDRIRAAARMARIADVIESLPQAYDTPLDALDLSGGETQRLGLAQAFARDPELLVLDDPTSSLDLATEHELVAALGAAAEHRTCVVMSARRGVRAAADRVLDLDRVQLHDRAESLIATAGVR